MSADARFKIEDSLQKVLLISAEEKILSNNSSERERIIEIAKKMKELHVVVLSKEKLGVRKNERIGKNIWIYPTLSSYSFLQVFDAWKIVSFQIVWKFKLWANIIVSEQPTKTVALSYFLSLWYRTRLAVYLDFSDIYDLYAKSRSSFWPKKMMFNAFSKKISERALSIRIPSDTSLSILESVFPDIGVKTFIIPTIKSGATTKKISPAADKTCPVTIHDVYKKFNIIFLCITDFYSVKDLRKTFDLFAMLKKRYPLSGLVCMSRDKPHRFDYMKKIHKFGTSVVYDPLVNTLPIYFPTATLFLNISDDARNAAFLTDAAMNGAAVITSNIDSAKNIIIDGQSGKICMRATPEEFFSTIISTLESPGTTDLYRITIKDSMRDMYIENIEQYAIYYKYFLKKVYVDLDADANPTS